MTKTKITDRAEYVALFATLDDAINHESACLAIDWAQLPADAILVLCGVNPTAAYWQWLADQIEEV